MNVEGRCVPLHTGICGQVIAVVQPGEPPVVVKVYKKELLNHRLQRNVQREVAVLTKLHQVPGVIELLDASEDAANVYLFFAPCEGGDLFRRLQRQPLNEEGLMTLVVRPLLEALARVHAAGVVHRDIKPENLFFTATGALVLGDFGLAIDTSLGPPRTRLGTPDYLAPEVICRPRPGGEASSMHDTPMEPYTSAVDVWAVGALMYECLVGAPAFPGGIHAPTAAAMVRHALRGLHAAGCSPACLHLMAAALQVDASRRPSAQELLLHPWLTGQAAEQPPHLGGCKLRPVGLLAPLPAHLSAPCCVAGGLSEQISAASPGSMLSPGAPHSPSWEVLTSPTSSEDSCCTPQSLPCDL